MITLNLPRDIIISTSILHYRAAQQATQGPDVTPAYIYVALTGLKLQLFFTGIHKLERNTAF